MTDTDMLYMAALEKRNSELEAKVAELEDKHWNECRQIAHYDDELRKAKELLKAAVEAMKGIADNERAEHVDEICCGYCDYDSPLTEYGEMLYECPGCDCNECFKWKHEAEALALIGEDTNVPATADDIIVGRRLYGWISCEERLPEDNTTVLYVWRSENGNVSVFHGWHGSIRGLGGAWHQSGVGMQRPEDEVTHWMPLPEPPKE